jgi:hypothetical protein
MPVVFLKHFGAKWIDGSHQENASKTEHVGSDFNQSRRGSAAAAAASSSAAKR